MRRLYFVGQLPLDAPVYVPGVSGEPMRGDVAYEVDDDLADILLARADWIDASAVSDTAKEPWALFVAIDRVDELIARAMWDAGYRSRADVAQAVESEGWQVLKKISGIGDSRAQVIAAWSQESE